MTEIGGDRSHKEENKQINTKSLDPTALIYTAVKQAGPKAFAANNLLLIHIISTISPCAY